MSRGRLRQIARLEQRALPYIARQQRERDETRAKAREWSFIVAANLALLLLYGDPKISEPLTDAWQRCLQSEGWKELRARHPDPILVYGFYEATPFDNAGAKALADYFRQYILPILPDADDTAKLNAVFANAPRWLLWFTHMDVMGHVLGLHVSDFSSKSRYERPRIAGHLPEESFEWRRRSDGGEDVFAIIAREHEHRRVASLEKLTPRERMRALRLRATAEQAEAAAPRVADPALPDGATRARAEPSAISGVHGAVFAAEHRGRRHSRR
jgi:hypothetical protein